MEERKIYKINNHLLTYSSYETFIRKHASEFIDFFIEYGLPSYTHRYYFICEGRHPNGRDILVIIQDIQTQQVYVVEKSTLEEAY